MNLQPGDRIRIVAPNDWNSGPGWGESMDKFTKETEVVREVLVTGEILVENDAQEYLFAPEWCIKE